ncbi:hypothetical protein [Azospirillum brasilense]|uniref:hypothetical protein n=1 Tax=Azospirillum brasilense TaxID=192 RepID=UPI0011EEFE9C|nr:hypothetical protein [Azospirillum brasilense]
MLRVLAVLLVVLHANGASAGDDAPNREAYLGHILCARTVMVSFDTFLGACQMDEEKDVQENIRRNIDTFDNFIENIFEIEKDKIIPRKEDLTDELFRIKNFLGNDRFYSMCRQRWSKIKEDGLMTKIINEITEKDLQEMSRITASACF